MSRVEPLAGIAMMTLVLVDVFLTVLYARAGTGILSDRLAGLIWRAFRTTAAGRYKGRILSFCGPIIVVAVLLNWWILLSLGAALIVHPHLGTSIIRSNDSTPTDFVTALYVAGGSLSIVGSSNFTPQTASTKILFFLNSLIGTSVISLTLTYLMQIYGALRERNSFCLKVHALSGETGDAAELLARLFVNGRFSTGYNNLSELASQVGSIKEAHHFYPVLFYFRFPEPYYSISRAMLVILDAVSLIRSVLAGGNSDWLKKSAATAALWSVSLRLLSTLKDMFLRSTLSEFSAEPKEADLKCWRSRLLDAERLLQEADLQVANDKNLEAELYVRQRREWDCVIRALGASMAYDMSEVDTACRRPRP